MRPQPRLTVCSQEDALRAITLSAAEVLGVADRVGSIAVDRGRHVFPG